MIPIPSYPRTLHWPASQTVHRDDQYHDDSTHFLNRHVIITEKLDGGVTGISNAKVYARSSGAPTSLPWFDYVKATTLPKLYGVPSNLCVFGEDLYGIHSIEYDPLPDTFFLFHILERCQKNIDTANTEGDRFWSWDDVKEFAQQYRLHHVPVLYDGQFSTVDQITEWFFDQISQPSTCGPTREGFVMRIAEGFPFDDFGLNSAKFVRRGHVQTDEHWSKHWKPARLLK